MIRGEKQNNAPFKVLLHPNWRAIIYIFYVYILYIYIGLALGPTFGKNILLFYVKKGRMFHAESVLYCSCGFNLKW